MKSIFILTTGFSVVAFGGMGPYGNIFQFCGAPGAVASACTPTGPVVNVGSTQRLAQWARYPGKNCSQIIVASSGAAPPPTKTLSPLENFLELKGLKLAKMHIHGSCSRCEPQLGASIPKNSFAAHILESFLEDYEKTVAFEHEIEGWGWVIVIRTMVASGETWVRVFDMDGLNIISGIANEAKTQFKVSWVR